MQEMMGQSPRRGGSPMGAIAAAIKGHSLSKGMTREQNKMEMAEQAERDRQSTNLSQMMGAYRGDTPYNQTPAETFPGEQPIPGLRNEGTGQNRNALLQAMASNPDTAAAGLKGLIELPKGTGTGPIGKAQPGDFTAESLQKFNQSGNYNDLDRVEQKLVKVDRGDRWDFIHPKTAEIVRSESKKLGPKDKLDYVEDKAVTEATAKGQVERWDTQMDEGLRAADGLPVIQRSLGLLAAGVKTGGWDNLKLAASNFFGVTGADEAELSANLGRAVLSQLRSTFGAAFTEREGDRLARIEAGFGKSTEANVRLLKELDTMARREAKRGIRAAKRAKDMDTAMEIQKMLDYEYAEPMQNPTQDQYDALEKGDEYTYDGKKYFKGQ